MFDSELAFHEDFLAQVEDLRKASLVFVEGILGMRETSSSVMLFGLHEGIFFSLVIFIN